MFDKAFIPGSGERPRAKPAGTHMDDKQGGDAYAVSVEEKQGRV